MSPIDPAQVDHPQETPLATAEVSFDQGRQAYNSLIERITPWLFEVGSWIFGGLIAFTLLIMASLITVGPVDLPIKIATVAFALVLPLNVTGLLLLRLVRDVKPVGFEEGIARAFQEAGLIPGAQQVPSLTALETVRKRGTRNVLNTALAILTLSSILTVVGLGAALWHMVWWIAVAFVAMVFICQTITQIVLFTSQPRLSKEEKAQRKRHHDEVLRQAKEQARQANRRK